MQPAFIAKTMRDCPAFRTAEGESNYFVMVFDMGGDTPPKQHLAANEYFFVLHGQGRACIGGEVGSVWKNIATGDALLVRPGMSHVVENLGAERLYCLTLMVPDACSAALSRTGIAGLLGAANRAVCGTVARSTHPSPTSASQAFASHQKWKDSNF